MTSGCVLGVISPSWRLADSSAIGWRSTKTLTIINNPYWCCGAGECLMCRESPPRWCPLFTSATRMTLPSVLGAAHWGCVDRFCHPSFNGDDHAKYPRKEGKKLVTHFEVWAIATTSNSERELQGVTACEKRHPALGKSSRKAMKVRFLRSSSKVHLLRRSNWRTSTKLPIKNKTIPMLSRFYSGISVRQLIGSQSSWREHVPGRICQVNMVQGWKHGTCGAHQLPRSYHRNVVVLYT